MLNEVYPAASKCAIDRMNEQKVSYYHLAGIKGVSFPKFPGAYAGAVPCCAGVSADRKSGRKYEVVVNRCTQ